MTNEEFIKSVSLPGEEWRDVVGYEGIYMASSLGRIASLQREVEINNGAKKTVPFYIKRSTTYYVKNYHKQMVNLYKKGKRHTLNVHKIIAAAFLENPNNYPEIDHIDGDTMNNSVSNLRYCTRKQNMNNPITRRRNSESHIGKFNNARSKKIVQLRNGEIINVFNSIRESVRCGFSERSVGKCCRGKQYEYKGFQWIYLSDYEALIKSKNESKPMQSDYQQPQPPQELQLLLQLQFEPKNP